MKFLKLKFTVKEKFLAQIYSVNMASELTTDEFFS